MNEYVIKGEKQGTCIQSKLEAETNGYSIAFFINKLHSRHGRGSSLIREAIFIKPHPPAPITPALH